MCSWVSRSRARSLHTIAGSAVGELARIASGGNGFRANLQPSLTGSPFPPLTRWGVQVSGGLALVFRARDGGLRPVPPPVGARFAFCCRSRTTFACGFRAERVRVFRFSVGVSAFFDGLLPLRFAGFLASARSFRAASS